MDFATIRAQLASATGRQYWRCLEELAETAEFRDLLRREMPHHASVWPEGVNRRQFLTLMGASLALAGLTGCSVQPPDEKILPYVHPPERIVPGRPLFFATAVTLGGLGIGVLAESHEGRPTKIEGNPNHSASLGATDLYAQASVLDLYDPDRSQNILQGGRIANWDDIALGLRKEMAAHRQRKGAGLRILTESVSSPTLASQFEVVLEVYPQAKWIQYDPLNADNVRAGSRLAWGDYVNTLYRFDQADVVLALDSDFLGCGPAHLRWAHDFALRQRAGFAGTKELCRTYAVEPIPSSLGSKADHRWPLRAAQVETFARAVAAELDQRVQRPPDASQLPLPAGAIRAIAGDLQEHRGASIVIAGEHQSPAVHALAHAMNHALGNVGKTVMYSDAVESRPADQTQALRELAEEMDAGQVDTLLILGANPAYTAPADLKFAERMVATRPGRNSGEKVRLRIHLGRYFDETAALCHWHIPQTHYLEQWSDVRAYDGTASIVQPLIAPLYGGRSAHELLAVVAEGKEGSGYEVVRAHWKKFWKTKDRNEPFEEFWATILNEGVIPETAAAIRNVSLRDDWKGRVKGAASAQGDLPEGAQSPSRLEIIFRADPTLYDGCFANNAWLQEVPRPLTKLTWGNAAMVSPATAEKYGLGVRPSGHSGEHGEATSDVVLLDYEGRSLKAPIWILPGHADDCVTLHLGCGRQRAGSVGTNIGFNAYSLRTSLAPWSAPGLTIERTGQTDLLASTQQHFRMNDRQPVRVTIAGEGHDTAEGPQEGSETLYPGYEYNGYKWAMVIDLGLCSGCNACVVACQAENNIPVVGKEQVMAGREMHWIRIDRYYSAGPGDATALLSNPEIYFQPLPCMHCETAPCELVCPVGATVHSDDGLNDMVYNRCVGTRYCSNNCPYKVRRFNFLQFADFQTPARKLLHNPDVTVRSRGVMEKCTYCVQRIRQAEIQAEREDRKIRDGEVLTACQAACPNRAIVFGDLNDPASEVSRRRAESRNYGLLADLNTQPRTTYLAVVRNPHPDLKNEQMVGWAERSESHQ